MSWRLSLSQGTCLKVNLQFLTLLYAYHVINSRTKDLIFREPAPTSAFEDEQEVGDDDGNSDWEDKHDMHTWDNFVIDSEDNDDE
jgi:hypothetical protein